MLVKVLKRYQQCCNEILLILMQQLDAQLSINIQVHYNLDILFWPARYKMLLYSFMMLEHKYIESQTNKLLTKS